jgi:hypothetical protein
MYPPGLATRSSISLTVTPSSSNIGRASLEDKSTLSKPLPDSHHDGTFAPTTTTRISQKTLSQRHSPPPPVLNRHRLSSRPNTPIPLTGILIGSAVLSIHPTLDTSQHQATTIHALHSSKHSVIPPAACPNLLGLHIPFFPHRIIKIQSGEMAERSKAPA